MSRSRIPVPAVPAHEYADAQGEQVLFRLSDRAFYLYGRGHLTVAALEATLRAIEDLNLVQPYDSYIDWFDLVSYDHEARQRSIAWCVAHPNRLDCIYIGTSSKTVWMGLYIVNLTMKGRIRPCKGTEELEHAVRLAMRKPS